MAESVEMNYPPTIVNTGDKADLLDKISPEVVVDIMRNRLMGKELIDGVWTDIPALQHRALTQIGAWDISTLILAVSSKNVSISKLKDDEIKKRALNIAKQAQAMCLKNWKEYGIKGTDQLGFVHEVVFSIALITLKQPQDEGIRKMIIGTISENRNYNQDENKKKFELFRQ